MRWVTYLSPSGGGERSGVIDDGEVYGHPGGQELAALLDTGADGLAAARTTALDTPLEIIVEFETRLCLAARPQGPVPVVLADGTAVEVAPELVRGTDDGVPLPVGPGPRTVTAAPGAAVLRGPAGGVVGRTAACLWRASDGSPVCLTVGPAVVTPDEAADASGAPVSAEADGAVLARGAVPPEGAWAAAGPRLSAAVAAVTRPLDAGEEVFVDAGDLGVFEVRVGAQA